MSKCSDNPVVVWTAEVKLGAHEQADISALGVLRDACGGDGGAGRIERLG